MVGREVDAAFGRRGIAPALRDDVATLMLLLDRGADISRRADARRHAAHLAAHHGRLDLTHAVARANVHAADDDGWMGDHMRTIGGGSHGSPSGRSDGASRALAAADARKGARGVLLAAVRWRRWRQWATRMRLGHPCALMCAARQSVARRMLRAELARVARRAAWRHARRRAVW